MHMKKYLIATAMIGAVPLAACGPSTPAAQNVESAADNTADAMEANAADIRSDASNTADAVEATADNKADAVENRADAVRDAGENRAEAIDKKKGQ
jgi:cell division septum initiation protein DivIVA